MIKNNLCVNKNVLYPRQRDSLSAQLDLTVTKAESEQLARALQEEQYFELSQENKKAGTRHKQEIVEKEATIARVSKINIQYIHRVRCYSPGNTDNIEISLQLEESNKTLTKDVENLSKEKSELNEKLRGQEEGTVPLLTFFFFLILRSVIIKLLYKQSLFFLTEYLAQKEEITNTIKANYEKVLNTERTLKTQVKTHLFIQGMFAKSSKANGECWPMFSNYLPNFF